MSGSFSDTLFAAGPALWRKSRSSSLREAKSHIGCRVCGPQGFEVAGFIGAYRRTVL